MKIQSKLFGKIFSPNWYKKKPNGFNFEPPEEIAELAHEIGGDGFNDTR